MPFHVQGLDHVALGVADQGAEESWYTDVLGLEREFAGEWGDTVDRENFDGAQDDFRARGIPFEFADHDVAHSIYFEDPAGLQLELTTYEL